MAKMIEEGLTGRKRQALIEKRLEILRTIRSAPDAVVWAFLRNVAIAGSAKGWNLNDSPADEASAIIVAEFDRSRRD